MAVEIILNLQGHCIETAARKEYQRLMDRVFTEDVSGKAVEEEIELLHEFLDSADFSALRASDEQLAGISGGSARLFRREKAGLRLVLSENSQDFYV